MDMKYKQMGRLPVLLMFEVVLKWYLIPTCVWLLIMVQTILGRPDCDYKGHLSSQLSWLPAEAHHEAACK